MLSIGRLKAFIRRLLNRKKVERELDEEVNTYLDILIERHSARGLSPEQARRAARIEFEGPEQVKERVREIRAGAAIETTLRDAGYGWRVLRKSPAFTLIAVLTLTFGIGANTAIFSVFEAAILRPLPVPNPQQLHLVQIAGSGFNSSFSDPLFRRMSDALPAGASLAAMTRTQRGQISIAGGSPEPASYQLVSSSFFRTLGVGAFGRVFTSDDDRTIGGHPVAVISHSYWIRRWSGSPDVLGMVVYLNSQPLTVIGVADPGFTGTRIGDSAEIWVPLSMQWHVKHFSNVASFGGDNTKPWSPQENLFWLDLILRLPTEVQASAVTSALDAVFQRTMEHVHGKEPDPEERRRYLSRRITLAAGSRGLDTLRERYLTPLGALFAMSGLVLLIACANIASLLMSRAESRQREIAVRMSIGAARGRLVRQLLTESLLLALLGSIGGAFAGTQAAPALMRLFGGPVSTVSPNLRVLIFNAGLCVLTTVAFGLAPALRSTKVELAPTLKLGGGAVGPGHRFAFDQTMVAAQVALSVVLLIAAALLSRTLYNLSNVNPGYEAAHVLTVQIDPRLGGYKESEFLPLYRRIETIAGGVPGVMSASISQCPLATGTGCGNYSSIYAGGFVPARGQEVQAQELYVGWDYLRTMGLRLVRGRGFTERDTADSRKVVIVNQTLARYYFGHDDVVGRHIGYSFGNPKDFEIVGILRDMPVNNLREPIPRFVLHPIAQDVHHARNVDVRAYGDPVALASAIRRALRQAEPNLPVYGIRTMSEQINATFSQERAIARLSLLFSGLATGLACLGLYGLIAYRVSRRTAEIGIRMALGAEPASVQWLILRGGLGWTLAGLAVGVALSAVATRSLHSLLFGISSTDGITYITVSLAVAASATVASLLPARRASRIDPVTAMRCE